MTTNWLTKYKNIGNGNPLNVGQNIFIEDNDTNIPLNLPTFIVGSKNAGKSTLISTLIKAESLNNVYKRIFYIYTDHVDSTLAETCHETLVRIPLEHAVLFISQYFKIKTEYMSWIKFIDKNKLSTLSDDMLPSLSVMLKTYTDNVIDSYVRNNINNNKQNDILPRVVDNDINKLKSKPEYIIREHAISYVLKYSQPFDITVDQVVYHMDGLRYNQYDQLIIDDVGVAAPVLFPSNTNPSRSPLYKFLTISRHILLGTIIAGQDTLQIPKYARKEINTYVFGFGITITDIDKTNITKGKQREIIKLYNDLEQYDFVIYNGIDNVVVYLDMQ